MFSETGYELENCIFLKHNFDHSGTITKAKISSITIFRVHIRIHISV